MISIQGKGVSSGVGVGPLYFYHRTKTEIPRYTVTDPDAEWHRFKGAQTAAIEQLGELAEKARAEAGDEAAMLFETHQMMAEDLDYEEAISDHINNEKMNAEAAISDTAVQFAAMFESMDDSYMQARAADVRDVSDRILGILSGAVQGGIASDVPVLLAADDLAPSETVQLDKSKILGFITAGGSGSSHTAILARTMGIPAIVGVGDALKPEYEGRPCIIDGATGNVVIDPDDMTRDYLLKKREEQLRLQRLLETLKGQPNVTKDGKSIRIYCNIGSPDDVHAVQVNDGGGIGLFVAFVGLQNAKLIVNSDSTLVTYQHFKGETFHSVGVGAILALIGVAITGILLVKKVKGGILYGILITWVLGILCEVTGIYVPNADAGMYSVIPTAFVSFDFSALGKTFGQVFKTDFSHFDFLNFFAVMFSFLFVDLFDTLGTLIGVASKADMLDEDGKLPHIKGALMADSIATCAGAVLGTSTTTTFVESASGVTEGGRTGLTSMTTGVLFLLATIFSPLFLTIPSFATAPALIIVGFYMMGSAVKIDFNDPSEGIPAFLTVLAMPTAYSISEGIAIGVISWTIINVVTGKAKEKKISPLMYVLTVLFILKYICL